jgi:hypothetical protein
MLSGIMKALYLFAWSHFLRRTGTHFAGKCSSDDLPVYQKFQFRQIWYVPCPRMCERSPYWVSRPSIALKGNAHDWT